MVFYFLRLVRWPNLLIVALTQYFLHYGLIVKRSEVYLPDLQFALLVLSTVLIAAGGNVVNDIFDVEIDKINKPIEKQIVGRIWSLFQSWVIYAVLVFVGFAISLYLAFFIENFVQILIYPFAVALLWIYSKYLKCSVLWGNLLVSAFCAFVAWIVWYAQVLYARTDWAVDAVFLGYGLFAFVSNMLREVIKDLEDAGGDGQHSCRTLPVVYGTIVGRGVAFGIGFIFLGLLFAVHFFEAAYPFKVWILDIGVGLPLIWMLYRLSFSSTRQDFARLSRWAKWLMLVGILVVLF